MEISLLNIIKENVGSLIIAGVTIIGFFVTNHSMKKSFENELKKQRNDIALDNMSKMPLQPIYLNGKSNYCKKETTIKNAVKAYCSAPQSDKKVNIFLCVDTDDISGGQAAENAILN